MTLCPLVDGSLDVMLGCTDHSRESEHSRRSDRSRGSDHMDKDCSNSRDVVSTGAAMRNSSTKSHSTGCSDVRRLSCVRGAGVAVCSTQVNWCPLEQLPCLDVSAVDQSVTDSMCSVAPVTDTRTHGLRLYPADDDILAPRAECDILCVDWNGDVGRVRVEAKVHSKVQDATKLDDVDNKKQRGHQQIGNETVDTMTERHNRNRSEEISEQQEEQRLVDTMTERHDRNSSEEILLSEQQEEQRLVDTMTERHDRNSSEEILLSEQQEEQRLVDTMTERHDRNSSEEILLSEQQEEQRLVDTMTERHDRNSSEEILLSEQQEEQRLVDTMTERHDRNSSEEILLSEQQEEQRLVDTMTERHDRNSSEEILLSEQQEEQRLVDTMTERHDRNSSEEILLNEQQEEQRLVDITKTSTVVSDPLDEPMTEPDSPRHLSPVLISLAPPVLQSTRVTSDREPVICIPLSGSETFTQMPRQKRHESGSRWDVGVLYEPKHQRKHRRARKLYTEAVLLPTEDPPIPADWADDNSLSRKDKSCLIDRNEATSCSQPDNCMIISSSSEHCTPASPVDDIARSSGNTISSTNNDSVESSELDGAAVQRLEVRLTRVFCKCHNTSEWLGSIMFNYCCLCSSIVVYVLVLLLLFMFKYCCLCSSIIIVVYVLVLLLFMF